MTIDDSNTGQLKGAKQKDRSRDGLRMGEVRELRLLDQNVSISAHIWRRKALGDFPVWRRLLGWL
jgi:hypothetical protein